MAVRCAVGLPNVGEYGDPRLLVALAEEAEAAGWSAVFAWDHVAYRERGWPVADPYVAVAGIAQATSRIRLGVLDRGDHYTVEETVFRPRPLQRPRIPIWVAGRWPARRSFRRAARWEACSPPSMVSGTRTRRLRGNLERRRLHPGTS